MNTRGAGSEHAGEPAMNTRVALLFGVHAHQPAGNFPEVVDRAHRLSYGPFLRTVHEYPRFRFAAHFSGPLLDQLAERFPEDIALLREMAARGQAELIGAGDAEPVLAAIPHRDRVGQVERLSTRLAADFGVRPQGAWLTERVWEASVVTALTQCGIRYAMVDDYHFLCTGRTCAELDGYYTTEEEGRTLDLFPISEALRYRVPFALAQDTVRFIEGMAGTGPRRAAIYFDDIEKFGVWPETHDWVFTRRWLRDFIEGVLASPAIESIGFSEFRQGTPTRGLVYLPTTSYIEMGEWSLPPSAAEHYDALVRGEKDGGRYERVKGFVRGGIWRNFLSRYPEANWMHKRMLALSERLDALERGVPRERLRDLLYLAQANDAYWHGLFGGLYLPHLRRAVWRNLLLLEQQLDRLAPRPAVERIDLDLDGTEEIFVHDDRLQIVVRGDGSAAIRELSAYPLAQNFGDTLCRRSEHYHRRVREGHASNDAGSGIASAHDRVSFKHAIGDELLVPDPRPRDLARDTWIDAGGRAVAIDRYRPRAAEGRSLAFECALPEAVIEKRIALSGDRVELRYTVRARQPGRLRCELDLAMPSCDGVAGRYLVGATIPCGFGQGLILGDAASLTLDDRFMGGAVELALSPPAALSAAPHFTVSQSEEGFEKVMQSATVSVEWAVAGPDGDGDGAVEGRGAGVDDDLRRGSGAGDPRVATFRLTLDVRTDSATPTSR